MSREEKRKQVLEILKEIIPTPDKEKLIRESNRLLKSSSCLKNNVELHKSMIGSGVTWGYLPHFMDVRVGKNSLSEKLKDEKTVNQIVEKTINFCDKYESGKISRNRVFQSLKAYNGHHVSNFRPVAARDIYLSLVGKNKSIFDACSGWGGRMMGAFGAEAKKYFGIDASLKTVDGLNNIALDLETSYSVEYNSIEDFHIASPFADISFTSPPYFDTEEYSLDEKQSWVRYKNYDDWREKFLYGLCIKMKEATEKAGYVVINIADVKKYPLEKDTNEILKKIGLKYINTYKYIISSISGKGIKYEPVFIYKNV